MAYKKKNKGVLAFQANVKRIRCEANIVLQEVLNSALAEMSDEFDAAFNDGNILEIECTPDELKKLLLRAAQRELGTGKQHAIKD